MVFMVSWDIFAAIISHRPLPGPTSLASGLGSVAGEEQGAGAEAHGGDAAMGCGANVGVLVLVNSHITMENHHFCMGNSTINGHYQ